MCIVCSRCTGYRPILDAFRVFAKGDSAAYTEEAIAASKAAAKTNGRAHTNGSSNGTHPENGHTKCSGNNGHDGCNGKTNGSATTTNGNSNGQSVKTNGKVCHLLQCIVIPTCQSEGHVSTLGATLHLDGGT